MIRRLAVSAAAPHLGDPQVVDALVAGLASDEDDQVRSAAAEVLAQAEADVGPALLAATSDPSEVVVEAVAFALGEQEVGEAVPWLLEVAADHADRAAREAAVAALGAIGDRRALPLLAELAASGPPQLRRRSVVALSAFDDPEAVPAIRSALEDRNPMVREAAEMVLGKEG